jgi:hypothetical protein
MNMELDEAVAIRTKALEGQRVQAHILRQAMQVITVSGGIAHHRMRAGWLEPINPVQRERLNMILAFKLAKACGKFIDWSST